MLQCRFGLRQMATLRYDFINKLALLSPVISSQPPEFEILTYLFHHKEVSTAIPCFNIYNALQNILYSKCLPEPGIHYFFFHHTESAISECLPSPMCKHFSGKIQHKLNIPPKKYCFLCFFLTIKS